jgi:hypothetical protein
MGYHDDTCAAIILHVCQEKRCDDQAIPQIEKEVSVVRMSLWWFPVFEISKKKDKEDGRG